MKFSVNLPGDEDRLRKAFRTKVPGFRVQVTGGRDYQVRDISASGFAVVDSPRSLSEGTLYETEFFLNKKKFLGGVQARVVRFMSDGLVGFSFENLERRQQMKLDKLVLEIQKRLIELKKARKRELGED